MATGKIQDTFFAELSHLLPRIHYFIKRDNQLIIMTIRRVLNLSILPIQIISELNGYDSNIEFFLPLKNG